MRCLKLIKIAVVFENTLQGHFFKQALKSESRENRQCQPLVVLFKFNEAPCLDGSYEAVVLDQEPIDVDPEKADLSCVKNIFWLNGKGAAEPYLFHINRLRNKFPFEEHIQKAARNTPMH